MIVSYVLFLFHKVVIFKIFIVQRIIFTILVGIPSRSGKAQR